MLCHDDAMGSEALDDVLLRVAAQLRARGAVFGLVFGSRARGEARPDSDLDVAAWWGHDAPQSFEVLLPDGVDLLVLDKAPLELAGRAAMEGRVFFDDDPARRVRWVATTRKIYSDELPRIQRSHREFAESLTRGR